MAWNTSPMRSGGHEPQTTEMIPSVKPVFMFHQISQTTEAENVKQTEPNVYEISGSGFSYSGKNTSG